MQTLPPSQHLRARKASELALETCWDDFCKTTDSYTIAKPAGVLPLDLPFICPGSSSQPIIQRPLGQPPQPDGFLQWVSYPQMTLARLSNVLCVPGGVAIHPNGTLIAESFSAYWETRPHHYIEADGNIYHLKSPVKSADFLPGKSLLIDYQHLDHFGHFLFDVVSRMWAIEFARMLGIDDLNILIRDTPAPYIQPVLKKFGVADEQIQRISMPVICEELFIATKATQIQEYTSPLAQDIWRTLSKVEEKFPVSPRRIYITRSGNGNRPLVNEADVEAIFREFGFDVVQPETRSMDDQIRLFAGAEFIAGSGGSNMFNIAFQKYCKSTLILTSPLLVHYSEQFFNSGHGSTLSYFVGAVDHDSPLFMKGDVNAPWKIADLNALRHDVEIWLSRASIAAPSKSH